LKKAEEDDFDSFLDFDGDTASKVGFFSVFGVGIVRNSTFYFDADPNPDPYSDPKTK
jgi:hypothetical protein